MKKMLILLAVATIPSAGGCCCARLCPCLNWCNRGAYCAPAPTYAAPLVTSPCPPTACPPTIAPAAVPAVMPQQFAMPSAVPAMAAPWPGAVMSQTQPMYYAEPGCAYVEPGCGAPYMGNVGYGGMPVDYGMTTGGCCGADGGMVTTPTPEAIVDPVPTAE
jgi:hypothetical protein